MSDNSAVGDFKKYGWLLNLVGVYLGLCVAMHFIFSPDEQYNAIIKKCGDSSAFCACQAQAIVDQRGFLNTPLIILGLKTYKAVAPMCSGHKG